MLSQVLVPIGDPLLVLLMLNVLLLVLGCVMEAGAILLLLVPVFMPVAHQLGIDPVHLGVVMVLNLMIGLSTPPVGLSLLSSAGSPRRRSNGWFAPSCRCWACS
jgi:TRAP-type C4-dicarboxylate transport system permease large subunit